MGERLAAVAGDVDRNPLAAQTGRDRLGQDLVVGLGTMVTTDQEA